MQCRAGEIIKRGIHCAIGERHGLVSPHVGEQHTPLPMDVILYRIRAQQQLAAVHPEVQHRRGVRIDGFHAHTVGVRFQIVLKIGNGGIAFTDHSHQNAPTMVVEVVVVRNKTPNFRTAITGKVNGRSLHDINDIAPQNCHALGVSGMSVSAHDTFTTYPDGVMEKAHPV